MEDTEREHVSGPHRRTLYILWLAALGLILLAWWQVNAMVSAGRERELATAERDLANLTRVSQEHANRTLRAADQVLRFVQAGYLRSGLRLDLAAMTADGVIDTEIFNQVGVIDDKGIYCVSNLPITGKLDLSDREHFKVHLMPSSGDLFVSKPVLGRASGKWSIQLSRRITRLDGSFAGVAVVSIDPGYFTRFYGDLNLGRRGVHGLFGLDGVVRARKVGPDEPPAKVASTASEAKVTSIALTSPMFEKYAAGEHSGGFTQKSAIDGVERHYYFRKIPMYPLLVVAGLDTGEMLANHERSRSALWSQGVISTMLILALAAALTRYLQRMRQSLIDRQKARDLLLDRTEQLNAIFALSPDGFVSFDESHRVKYVSPAFVQMADQDDDKLSGLTEQQFSDWLSSNVRQPSPFSGVAAMREEIAAGTAEKPLLVEMNVKGRRTLQVGLRLSNTGSVSQIMYFRDVTREVEVDQMKSEFLSTAAHELRTPMASILGFSEVLLHQETDALSRKEFLSIIHAQSKTMANILDELLDLARIEAHRGKDFRFVAVCLQHLLSDMIRTMSLPAGRLTPELRTPVEPVYVLADAQKLRQALLNVLSNAFKYSSAPNPVDLRVELGPEDAAVPSVCIVVSDSGIGMTAEQVSRVCERFYRADSSGKVSGTGLGMAIVKEIVELHRGSVLIESVLGYGTQVTLCLPLIAGIPVLANEG